jgi:hypothetical protein
MFSLSVPLTLELSFQLVHLTRALDEFHDFTVNLGFSVDLMIGKNVLQLFFTQLFIVLDRLLIRQQQEISAP